MDCWDSRFCQAEQAVNICSFIGFQGFVLPAYFTVHNSSFSMHVKQEIILMFIPCARDLERLLSV